VVVVLRDDFEDPGGAFLNERGELKRKKEEKKMQNHLSHTRGNDDELSPDDALTKAREVFTVATNEEDPSSSSSYHDEGVSSSRIKSLEAILRALGDRNARLSETNAELKEESGKYKLDADRIAERFAMVSERLTVAERERGDILERASALSEAYDAQTSECKRMERENEGLRRDEERDKKRARELEGEKRELEQELNASKLDLETLREKYANARADLTVVHAELDAYKWKMEAANAKIETLVRRRDAFNGLDEDYRDDDDDDERKQQQQQQQQQPLIPISPALVKGTQTKKSSSRQKTATSTNTVVDDQSFVLQHNNAKLLHENAQLKRALVNEEKMKLKALQLADEARLAAADAEKRSAL
jgi:chromosome segregation ATPase